MQSLKKSNKKKGADDSQQQMAPANPRKRGRPGANATLATTNVSPRDTPKPVPVLDLGSLHLILQLLYK
jgi:hypothetical protein